MVSACIVLCSSKQCSYFLNMLYVIDPIEFTAVCSETERVTGRPDSIYNQMSKRILGQKPPDTENQLASWALFDQVTFDRNIADFDDDDAAVQSFIEPVTSGMRSGVSGEDSDMHGAATDTLSPSIPFGQESIAMSESSPIRAIKGKDVTQLDRHSSRSSSTRESAPRSKHQSMRPENVIHDRYFFFGDLNYRYVLLLHSDGTLIIRWCVSDAD